MHIQHQSHKLARIDHPELNQTLHNPQFSTNKGPLVSTNLDIRETDIYLDRLQN